MDDRENDKITAFDALFTNNRIQMFKVLLTYLAPSSQKTLAIYIKFMELQYTISFFQQNPNSFLPQFSHEASSNTGQLCDEIMPFCDAKQRNQITKLKNIISNWENMQQMMATIQMIQELFPEGMGTSDTNSMDMSQLFNMFGGGDMPDLSSMADLFGSLHSTTDEIKSP
ncbi:MAG: hypothetical protein IJF07_01345 [Lachnospiraceae bacterium]|nr:hypothetical protein [Lachnospiraceae bacterium]